MPSTYTTNLGIEKIATGEQSGTWGTTTNTNLDLVDEAVNGIVTVTLAGAGSSGSPNTLAISNGASSDGRNKYIEFNDGGDLGGTAYVQLTPNDAEKIVHIRNSLSASRSILIFQGTYNASNDFEIPNGADVVLKFDGAGAGAVVSDVNVNLTPTKLTTANLVATSADINGGSVDGATLGTNSAITALTVNGNVSVDGGTIKLDGNYPTGTNNVALGNGALDDGSLSGNQNTAVGTDALGANTTGAANVAIGSGTLDDNTTGCNNTALGRSALSVNISGCDNTAVGIQALVNNTVSNNTAVGSGAGYNNSTGTDITGVGYQALYCNTSGVDNVATGRRALYAGTTASGNTAVGYQAAAFVLTGGNNVAIGKEALYGSGSLISEDCKKQNVAIGYRAMYCNADGKNNIAVGYNSLCNISCGISNVMVGLNSGYQITTGCNNVGVGHGVYEDLQTGCNNTALGYFTLANSTVSGSTAVGFCALRTSTTATNNTAVGYAALNLASTGSSNVAVGNQSLNSNTTGDRNIAVGCAALFCNSTGSNNVAIGDSALLNYAGSGNVAIGFRAGCAITSSGTSNTIIGRTGLTNLSTGSGNTAVGYLTAESLTTGTDNTMIGIYSLSGLTTGSGNVALGDYTGLNLDLFCVTTQSDRLLLGHSNITNAYVQVALTVVSDCRDKTCITCVPHGLAFVDQLNPVKYKMRKDRNPDNVIARGPWHYGFLAQDILALEGDDPVIIDDEQEDKLKYKGEHLVPVLVNAIKELKAKVETLEAEVQALKNT